jgi:hypothetical protein
MTFLHATPVLGIVNRVDRPHQGMVAVVFGNPEALKWSYVAPGADRGRPKRLDDPLCFTPLSEFGIRYGMTHDGRLRLIRFTIPSAKMPDGSTRQWQGADDCVIDVMPCIAAKVWGAVHAKADEAAAS